MAYDAESLLNDIKTILQADLNTRITAIVAEKGDSITPDAITNAGYFFQDLPPDNNITPWLIYGLSSSIVVETRGPAMKKEYVIEIALGNDKVMNTTFENIFRVFSRYTRAITEVLVEKFADIGGHSQLKIEEFPLPQIDQESGEVVSLPGVKVTATIA